MHAGILLGTVSRQRPLADSLELTLARQVTRTEGDTNSGTEFDTTASVCGMSVLCKQSHEDSSQAKTADVAAGSTFGVCTATDFRQGIAAEKSAVARRAQNDKQEQGRNHRNGSTDDLCKQRMAQTNYTRQVHIQGRFGTNASATQVGSAAGVQTDQESANGCKASTAIEVSGSKPVAEVLVPGGITDALENGFQKPDGGCRQSQIKGFRA